MLWRVAVDEVVWGPGAGELHAALLQLEGRGGVLILVALDGLVVDQVGDVEEHLAGLDALAGDFFREREKHAMHLDGNGAGFGLAARAGRVAAASRRKRRRERRFMASFRSAAERVWG